MGFVGAVKVSVTVLPDTRVPVMRGVLVVPVTTEADAVELLEVELRACTPHLYSTAVVRPLTSDARVALEAGTTRLAGLTAPELAAVGAQATT